MTPNPVEDLLRGTRQIAEYIGESVRRAEYLLEGGMLPAFKIGNRWNMRPSAYQKYISALESEALSRASARAARPSKVAA